MRFYKKGKHLSVRAATAKFLMDLPKESRDAIEALQKDIRQFLEANPEEEDDEQS
jgi:hypothetical protein